MAHHSTVTAVVEPFVGASPQAGSSGRQSTGASLRPLGHEASRGGQRGGSDAVTRSPVRRSILPDAIGSIAIVGLVGGTMIRFHVEEAKKQSCIVVPDHTDADHVTSRRGLVALPGDGTVSGMTMRERSCIQNCGLALITQRFGGRLALAICNSDRGDSAVAWPAPLRAATALGGLLSLFAGRLGARRCFAPESGCVAQVHDGCRGSFGALAVRHRRRRKAAPSAHVRHAPTCRTGRPYAAATLRPPVKNDRQTELTACILAYKNARIDWVPPIRMRAWKCRVITRSPPFRPATARDRPRIETASCWCK